MNYQTQQMIETMTTMMMMAMGAGMMRPMMLQKTGKTPKYVLDEAKMKDVYSWFKANEKYMWTWAGIRLRVYEHTVLGLTAEEAVQIPFSKRESPPYTWSIPPEYMVAYLRIARGMTKADAIKEVERDYIPRL